MKSKFLLFLAIFLQLIILVSFIARYEILKNTGTILYVPLRGSDPTDLFRGDYIALSYELPYSGTGVLSYDQYLPTPQYLVPQIRGNTVGGIVSLSPIRPSSGKYFAIKNIFPSELNQVYSIQEDSGSVVTMVANGCVNREYSASLQGAGILYMDREVQTIRRLTDEEKQNALKQGWKYGKVLDIQPCRSQMYQFQTVATDRWFVQEGKGYALEEDIRNGELYAEWRLGNDGNVIVTDIVSRSKIPK